MALSWASLGFVYLCFKQTKIPKALLTYLKLNKRIPESLGALTISLVFYKLSLPIRLKASESLIPQVYEII